MIRTINPPPSRRRVNVCIAAATPEKAFLEDLGEPAQKQMRATGVEFKWCAGQQPNDDDPAAAGAADAAAAGSCTAPHSVADMKSNLFKLKKIGFDVSKHITLKKDADATYKVLAISEAGAKAKEKKHGDLVGEEISMARLQPPRHPWTQGSTHHQYTSMKSCDTWWRLCRRGCGWLWWRR